MSSASETDLVELDWGGGCWSRVTFIVGSAQLHPHLRALVASSTHVILGSINDVM